MKPSGFYSSIFLFSSPSNSEQFQWRFALEWHPSRCAWDAILFSLDHLHLTAFALPPAYAVPALFLAFLADHAGDELPPAHVSAWGPVLQETVQALDLFLMTLYEDWIDGPSRAAFRYRQFTEYMPIENTEHGPLLAPFRSILGTDVLEAIRGAECLEATLLRTLCHASIRLWTKGDLPFPEQELALFLRSPQLHALLPLALWQSSAPIPQSLERRTSIHSMMSCISGNSTLASSKKRQEKEQKMGNHVWRLYAEAKAFVQTLGLKNQSEWRYYGRSRLRPVDIPSNPSQVYGEEFEGMGVWLGQGTRSTRNREFLPFEQARIVARSLHLKNAAEWYAYCKSAERPASLPAHPQETYKEDFQGFGDWLGTQTLSNWDRAYLPFEEARAFVHTLLLKNRNAWRAYCKAGTKPTTIPANPARTYDHEFQGFGDWLGTGTIATTRRTYRPYEQARTFVHPLGLKSQQEWRAYCATGDKPIDIPTSPHDVYGSAFRGWWDWLQIEGKWTRRRLLALLEDLRPHLPYLEERELYALLQHAGALPALTLALGKESPVQAIRALLMQEEPADQTMEEPGNVPFQEQEEDILSLLYEDAHDRILNDQDQANVIFSGDDGQQEASPSLFHSDIVPPLTQKGLQVVDQFASIPGILDTETVEYLITNRVSHLWDRYTEAGRAFVEGLLVGGEGAFFTTIHHRFLAEVDAVERLTLPRGWSFTDEAGRVLHANPMQRRTAWQILVRHRVGNWSGPGAGKTLSAILASRVCDAHLTLVVTNLATITGWGQQIKRAYPDSIVHTDVDDVAAQRQGSVFRDIQVIIPQVILEDQQGQTWSWDQTRWALIQ